MNFIYDYLLFEKNKFEKNNFNYKMKIHTCTHTDKIIFNFFLLINPGGAANGVGCVCEYDGGGDLKQKR